MKCKNCDGLMRRVDYSNNNGEIREIHQCEKCNLFCEGKADENSYMLTDVTWSD